ncbi:hypothetical protein ANN_27157 [Periplaneta americana]|uniref:Tc1-like transposase DDE domain-containing protein n=1 Tax=Periplaneta americana TaxID=6978 RepID=A0ABQ8RX86_PERAM|nr:hypothetical protein ANN_27157 [Periplaneta americana]
MNGSTQVLRPTQSAVKVMFIVVYDIDGVILHHAVPPRQTANADYYCRFLQHHLRPALRRKRRHLVVLNPIILHDNARSHTAAAVKDLLRRWQWEILEHPPYSPDMSPCDYHLFTKVKEPLRGTRHNTRDELIRAIGRSIRNTNKDGRADGVRRLPNIWQKLDKRILAVVCNGTKAASTQFNIPIAYACNLGRIESSLKANKIEYHIAGGSLPYLRNLLEPSNLSQGENIVQDAASLLSLHTTSAGHAVQDVSLWRLMSCTRVSVCVSVRVSVVSGMSDDDDEDEEGKPGAGT